MRVGTWDQRGAGVVTGVSFISGVVTVVDLTWLTDLGLLHAIDCYGRAHRSTDALTTTSSSLVPRCTIGTLEAIIGAIFVTVTSQNVATTTIELRTQTRIGAR